MTMSCEGGERNLTAKNQILTPAEWAVYECLWEQAPLTLTQIANQLIERKGWSRSTGETMVRRMADKGLIRWEQGEKAKLYYPVIRREDAALRETRSFLERVYHGSLGLMVSAVAEKETLSRSEIDELYAALKKLEENCHD